MTERKRVVFTPTRVLVPLSGGKDSQACLSIAVERYGKDMVTAVHNYTGIDHSLTYAHMQYLIRLHGCAFEMTNKGSKYTGILDLIEKRDIIPTRVMRVCTDEFKIKAMNRWLTDQPNKASTLMLMGMRAQESVNRMAKYGGDDGFSPDDMFSMVDLFPSKVPKALAAVRVQLPIVDRSTPWVFEFLRSRDEEINPLYARGHRRVGCYPCLLSGKNSFRMAARDPEGRKTLIKLDQLRDEQFKRKGIVPGTPVYDVTLDGVDLKKILADEDPTNPNRPRDPFGLDDFDEIADAGGCGVCAE